MIEEVDETVWRSTISLKCQSVFFDFDFLKLIASTFGYKLHLIACMESKKVVAAAALFSKKGKIVIPIAFTYASVYYDKGLSERKYLQVFKALIQYLQSKWKAISLRLSPEFKDLRPFIWAGFNIENRYTYIKNTGEGVHKSVETNYKKAMDEGLVFKAETADTSSIQPNVNFLREQGVLPQYIKGYSSFFHLLVSSNCLIALNAYCSGSLICSNLALVDRSEKKLYTLLIHKTANKYAHTFLYVKTIEWCLQQQIEAIDYCGANQEGIAAFKSYFNPALQPYYSVCYTFKNNWIKKGKEVVKTLIGRYG